MLANGKLLVTEFALVYGGPVSTLLGPAIAAYMVVRQVNVGIKTSGPRLPALNRTSPGESSALRRKWMLLPR